MGFIKSQLHFSNSLPKVDFKNQILVYDQILSKKYSSWIKKFPRRYSVSSGENLKDLKHFSSHMDAILKISEGIPKDTMQIVVFGGGSVGDFGGFVASILKRGVGLIHIPSTWLSAIDSSHGGKTALNCAQFKNQIGTFYPADKVYLVKSVLSALPSERVFEALGEVYKIGLISGGSLWKKISQIKVWDEKQLWGLLPSLVQAKLKIVTKDPFEKKGLRHVLNLGHTVGHVLESASGLPHGYAVLLGTLFALNWGKKRGITQPRLALPLDQWILSNELAEIKNPGVYLSQDKKISAHSQIRYIFVKNPGKVVVTKVKISELVTEWKRQALRV